MNRRRKLLMLMSGVKFDPSSLFANGEEGVWYEPKPEYLFQDSAGTIPVTTDGQAVGYMQDLSGNGNHAIQDTQASKPIYRTDGMLHWLEADGVDDNIATSTSIPALTGSGASVLFAIAYTPLDTSVGYLLHCDGATGAQDQQSFSVLLNFENDSRAILGGEPSGNNVVDIITDQKELLHAQFDKSNQTGVIKWSSFENEQMAVVGTNSNTSDPLKLFSRRNAVFFNGKLHGFIAVGGQFDIKTRSRLRNYVGAL